MHLYSELRRSERAIKVDLDYQQKAFHSNWEYKEVLTIQLASFDDLNVSKFGGFFGNRFKVKLLQPTFRSKFRLESMSHVRFGRAISRNESCVTVCRVGISLDVRIFLWFEPNTDPPPTASPQ